MLPIPNLADRTFDQLLHEARSHVAARCGAQWNDLSVHDPGMVLLEAFAHLTEVMLYRLNRVPERVYVELLNLIGISLEPPSAAQATLTFTSEHKRASLPRGTRVTASAARAAGGGAITFITSDAVQVEPGRPASVTAFHCEWVAEVIGQATGWPGQKLRVTRGPILAAQAAELELVVGVEVDGGGVGQEGLRALAGKLFRPWRAVAHFGDSSSDDAHYTVDRAAGVISFAPGALRRDPLTGELGDSSESLAATPARGRAIAAWYAAGGGARGNVAAHALDTLKEPIVGVRVSNEQRAFGGRDLESVENALIRGPAELYSLERAVTARDYEVLAQRSVLVARACALPKAARWAFATPGTVEVVLVPSLTDERIAAGERGVTLGKLQSAQSEQARRQVQDDLDRRRPIGTQCSVNWAKYKAVSVRSRVVRAPGYDTTQLAASLLTRLYARVSPLRSQLYPEPWPFGQSLGVDTIYGILLSEPGVAAVQEVELELTEAPRRVRCLAVDPLHPGIWYAGDQRALFRSVNSGAGWERAELPAPGGVVCVRPHPQRAGLIGVLTQPDSGDTVLWLSWDCGESFMFALRMDGLRDLAWLDRDGKARLFLAGKQGVFTVTLAGADQTSFTALQVIVDQKKRDRGFERVVAVATEAGLECVAAAALDGPGVYLSLEAGEDKSFRLGLEKIEVGVLAIQRRGSRAFLWAGAKSTGEDAGQGCFSRELVGWGTGVDWAASGGSWRGRSVRDLAFCGGAVYAASHSSGVLSLDSSADKPSWIAPDLVKSRLPQRSTDDPFLPLWCIASDGELLMVGSDEGISLSRDRTQYAPAARSTFSAGAITLPSTWLFCSETHQVEVISSHATSRY